MAQNVVDFSDNPTGAELMDDYLDKDQQNVLTSNSGIQRPSYAVAGTKWLDTSVTPWLWKMYDGTSDVTLGTVNPSTHLFTPAGVLPSQDGQSGKFLQTNGSNTVWTNVDLSPYQLISNMEQTITSSSNKYPSSNAVKTQLDGKANTALSNISSNIDIVTEKSISGTEWYRKYKSGWIEQGGTCTNKTKPVITFKKPFSNTNYNFIAAPCVINGHPGSPAWNEFSYKNKTTTSISMLTTAAVVYTTWYAYGQGA